MLVEVKVPILAESVAEATLMNWHKKTGDKVLRGDSLIDIETDKVTLEVAAPNDGVLVEIIKNDGEDVASDEVIARINTDAGAADKAAVKPAPAARAAAPAPAAIPTQQSLPVDDGSLATAKLSPAVRHLLEEHRLNAADIRHSDDRITREDVLAHIDQLQAKPPAVSEATTPITRQASEAPEQQPREAAPPPAPTPIAAPAHTPVLQPAAEAIDNTETKEAGRLEEQVPMTRLRRRTAERLLAAQQENAILTTFNDVNMQPVMELRQRYKDDFEKNHGVKLGFMSFFTKATVEALKKFPLINASIAGNDIIYHGYFDIGIAVSAPRGLVVPVVRDADTLSFAEIEAQIRDYGAKARDSKLTIDDLTGGTFTITNGGIFGSLLSTPIINPPQSAILGMHKIQERPVAEHGQVVIRPVMYLALSYDHRIIDGREAVSFLVTIKQQLEDPARLLLQI